MAIMFICHFFLNYMYIYVTDCGKIFVLDKHRASDKVVADDDEEKMLIVKHIQRLQVRVYGIC